MSIFRQPYEKHDYKGGLDSGLVFHLVKKYADVGETWLEQFPGGKVIEEICTYLGIFHATIDFKGGDDARELGYQDDSLNGVLSHPPYWTAIKYDEGNPRELSNCKDYDEFIREVGKTCDEAVRVIEPGGWFIMITGDVRKSRVLYPVHSDVIQYMKKFKNMILRDILMWELSSSSTPFISTKHMIQLNHCIIWEKIGHDARELFK